MDSMHYLLVEGSADMSVDEILREAFARLSVL